MQVLPSVFADVLSVADLFLDVLQHAAAHPFLEVIMILSLFVSFLFDIASFSLFIDFIAVALALSSVLLTRKVMKW